ncbi:unnamed protein product [Arctia plantaginis]|uniref:RNA-directed DNA polymerase n=1 Tax=Arctia plantaginis TaxID=874455 RepID=A0A8S1AHS0_ARCPL|nr:unnamed protein product [Arctia plantaginis]
MSQLQIPTIEPFDCEGDPTSLGSRWERWKRALEIYFIATDTNDQNTKRAILLHSGGMILQDIYFNIPGAHVTATDVYDTAVKKLDEYFSPKQSYLFERHLFRLMKQEPDEKFEKFLIRLRRQSSKCNFTNEDENLIDQITEKCSSTKLRKNILVLGDNATVAKIIAEANTLETVDRQLSEFHDRHNKSATSTSINKIDNKTVKRFTRREEVDSCCRCGSKNHKSDSSTCPAVNANCIKCGFKGHFQKHCRTRANKRKSSNFPPNNKYKKPKVESSQNKGSTSVDYIFHIDDDAMIDCQVGGVQIQMLIDSGSKSNIINDRTWEYMKQSQVRVSNQEKLSDKTFLAYGAKEPLKVLGSFEAPIKVGSNLLISKFYVIENGSRNLLGKQTAISLKVLKLGLGVNFIEQTPFPKFKDVQLEIMFDKTVRPVCQPYRRVPIPLESKINKKLDELVRLDIIEPVNMPSAWVSPMVPVLKPDDDIVVFGRDMKESQTRLEHVLTVLRDNNVLLNKSKCVFNGKSIQFLGHELSASGVKPLDKYIKTIETFRSPETIEEIQSFLGLINFVGKWIPNLSTLTEPIRQLLRQKVHKNANITAFWHNPQAEAFAKLKDCLSKIPTLGYYDPKDRTQVFADASPVGLGAVLIQYDNNEPRIIAFGNKSLSDVEKRYCQTEKEALALVWAIEHFHIYLYGKKFELVTDHKPLEVIFGIRSKPCARIERWVLRLQTYDYKVIYKPGKSNIADPLSRLCRATNSQEGSLGGEYHVNQIVQYARPIALPLKTIIDVSNNDKEFKLVKDGLLNDNWDHSGSINARESPT